MAARAAVSDSASSSELRRNISSPARTRSPSSTAISATMPLTSADSSAIRGDTTVPVTETSSTSAARTAGATTTVGAFCCAAAGSAASSVGSSRQLRRHGRQRMVGIAGIVSSAANLRQSYKVSPGRANGDRIRTPRKAAAASGKTTRPSGLRAGAGRAAARPRHGRGRGTARTGKRRQRASGGRIPPRTGRAPPGSGNLRR